MVVGEDLQNRSSCPSNKMVYQELQFKQSLLPFHKLLLAQPGYLLLSFKWRQASDQEGLDTLCFGSLRTGGGGKDNGLHREKQREPSKG